MVVRRMPDYPPVIGGWRSGSLEGGHRIATKQGEEGTMAVALSVRGVRKRFRTAEILRGVDLEVTPGEVVGLVGPNGAGKSTLLRIIIGTITSDAGEIHVAGHDVCRDPIRSRSALSWVLGDEHGWYWRLTGVENLVFFGMLRGIERRAALTRAMAQLESQGLAGAANQRVAEYSTGMRARLSLARATLVPTPVMILDEPGRGLDPAGEDRLSEFLRAVRHTAVLLVTHELEMVSRVASRTVLLDQGLIRGTFDHGTPAPIMAAKLAELGR